MQPPSIADPKIFRIPAGEPNWASPPVEMTVNVDADLVWMMPHMHFRGKDMTYRLTYPDGRTETALHVPKTTDLAAAARAVWEIGGNHYKS